MRPPHVLVIGGGLAGLAAGCYARASGFRTTILEHHAELGGVCTAWRRDAYTIDGCIHWLASGPFAQVYRELGVDTARALRPLQRLVCYRAAVSGVEVDVTRDLDGLARTLTVLSPDDAAEVALLIESARRLVQIDPGIARPAELTTLRDAFGSLWRSRHLTRAALHFRKPLSEYAADHLHGTSLRRLYKRMLPEDSSALFLALMLGYLERGELTRPLGGSAAFRDAIVATYERLGGEVRLGSTVDEIVLAEGAARGARLDDGTIVDADYVISTASMPDTVLHLLGGRHGLAQHAEKLAQWKMFDPVLLVSYGVSGVFLDLPDLLTLDQLPPFDVGGRSEDHLALRVFHDEPGVAPRGHTVVQALLATDYDYWAKRGDDYQAAKRRVADSVLEAITRQLPGLRDAVRMVDVATPLTYWRTARSWRGAFEGWRPNRTSMFNHLDKAIEGLSNVFLAGQWVEPGGGVPVSVLSGRHVVQLVCAHAGRPFVAGVG